MRRPQTALLLACAAVGIGSWSANVAAAPKIALNVDGQANYSFLAPWANIAGQFDQASGITYWTGYIDGQKWFEITDPDTLSRGPVHPVIQLDWFPKCDSPEPSELQVDWMRIYQ